jgi:hypothetical protein
MQFENIKHNETSTIWQPVAWRLFPHAKSIALNITPKIEFDVQVTVHRDKFL